MKHAKALIMSALFGSLTITSAMAEHGINNITSDLQSIEVMHNGKAVVITRTADTEATIPKTYAKIGHHCPPFCLQPAQVAPGVETVGELEVLGYLKRIASGDRTVMVVDSRTPEWLARGTIPGSVNIPWNKINLDVQGTFPVETEAHGLEHILQDQFGAHLTDGHWDFRNAKTLVLFCNGSWCPQSSNNIKTLLRLGYPAYKLKWYRGGMQDWVSMGLSYVTE